jgi:uncharacterized membrane protein YgcG
VRSSSQVKSTDHVANDSRLIILRTKNRQTAQSYENEDTYCGNRNPGSSRRTSIRARNLAPRKRFIRIRPSVLHAVSWTNPTSRYTQVTNKNNSGTFKESIQPGSKVIVCNASHCVTYQMTDSQDWNGTSREPITTSPPPRGGGGNGNGGGGGGGYTGPISGGSHGGGGGGGSGKVTVGPAKPSRPTHED